MISRSSLLKQLELSIQQEIKNYNDSLSTILLRLNHMNDSITQVASTALENDQVILSCLKQVEIEHQNFEEKQKEENRKYLIRDASIEYDLEILKSKFNCFYLHNFELSKNFKNAQEDLLNLSNRIENIENDIIGFTHQANHQIEGFTHQLKKDIANAKDEILSYPSKSEEIKDILEEKINSHAIDVEGVLKEIRSTNKQIMILEKKIENIYTLIERLQKKEDNP